jgi:hypothetical protein
MSQNVVTTRSGIKTSSPSTSKPLKTTSNTQKTSFGDKVATYSIPPSKLDYDFLEYLKITKANISLFELMNLPQI